MHIIFCLRMDRIYTDCLQVYLLFSVENIITSGDMKVYQTTWQIIFPPSDSVFGICNVRGSHLF